MIKNKINRKQKNKLSTTIESVFPTESNCHVRYFFLPYSHTASTTLKSVKLNVEVSMV